MKTKIKNVTLVPTSANNEVECAVCGAKAHVLVQHIKLEHGLSAVEYVDKYDAPLFSEFGGQIIRARVEKLSGSDNDDAAAGREFKAKSIEDLFGWEKEQFSCRVYEGKSPLVPTGSDEGFVYDYHATLALLFALHRKRPSCYIAGYSGTGKTQLVLNIARKLNREVIRLNLDSSLTRADIIGDWSLKGGQPYFNYGPLPRAMKRGAILLLDEYDLVNHYIAPLFRPILEDNPCLCIPENGGEVIVPSEGFAVVATANTWATGDESGLYGNTSTLSLADRQRFGLFVEVDYLEEEAEVGLLCAKVPDLEKDEANQFVLIANRIRSLYREGKIEEAVSPRQLVNWAEVFVDVGDVVSSANMAFLAPLRKSTQIAVKQLIEEAGFGPRKQT